MSVVSEQVWKLQFIFCIFCLSVLFFRRFEGLFTQGKSPTVELLADWGTTNSTVGELVDILKSQKLLAAASILLPGKIFFFFSDYKNSTAASISSKSMLHFFLILVRNVSRMLSESV